MRRVLLDSLYIRRYYVDATLGNDANDGRSSSNAWQTIARVNGETFNPGERILFKRGETWNGTITIPSGGTSGNRITMGAYGAGVRPILDGGASAAIQVTAANRGYWTIRNLDIRCIGDVRNGTRGIAHETWPAGSPGDVPGWIVENCIFNCGIRLTGANTIVRHNSFDGAGVAETRNVIWIDYLVSTNAIVEYNTVANAGERGIWIAMGADNPVVRYNIVHGLVAGVEVSFGIDIDGYALEIRGAIVEHNIVYDIENIGIGMENCYDNPRVRYNIIYDIHDGALSWICYDAHPATGSSDMRGVSLGGVTSNNLIYECENAQLRITSCSGLDFFHNTIADGIGAAHQALWIAGEAYTSDITFKNNIISNIFVTIVFPTDVTLITDHDYNCYHGYTTGFAVLAPWATYTLDEFKVATGQEADSFETDPSFVNAAIDDYHIQVGSPCRGAGVDVGVTTDLDGVVRGDPPDIGAYEYVA